MSPSPASEQHIHYLECTICKKSVKLEESKTDEYGQAVHEECYVSRLEKILAPGKMALADVLLRYSDSGHIERVRDAASWRRAS